jgi:hypothetical protein
MNSKTTTPSLSEVSPENSTAGNPQPGRKRLQPAGIVVGLLIGIVVAFIAAPALYRLGHLRAFGENDQGAMISQIRELRRLESVSFNIDKVVTGERSSLLPNVLTGDRILMIVRGEVVAGVDLSKLSDDDIHVDRSSIHIRLPNAEVFSTRIDNDKTRVYSRETGLLVQADPNLETEVRRAAERDIKAVALEDGILGIAANNARTTVQTLCRALGYRNIDVEFRSANLR